MSRYFIYTDKYYDDVYEYRSATVPLHLRSMLEPNKLLTEQEWRELGVQQSKGWEHYCIHDPEPYVLLFRKPLNNSSDKK